jgi:L-asparaginase II
MLARAHIAGWKTAGYEKRDHQVQQSCLESVAEWAGIDPREMGLAVDGCGVVEFSTPLVSMARAWARFATAIQDDEPHPKRIHAAVRDRPILFGGSDRFDSIVVEATEGRVVTKVGAEGVHAAAIPEQGIGFVIKVEDGSQRAQFPAVLRMLQYLDALPATLPADLEEFHRRAVRNTRGECVGEIRPIS